MQQEGKIMSSSDFIFSPLQTLSKKVKEFIIGFHFKKIQREDQVKPNIGRIKALINLE